MTVPLLWLCASAWWAASARALSLLRQYPCFCTFALLANAARWSWFRLDTPNYWRWYATTEYASIVLQVAVSVEAYVILARQVRNFGWRWRVLAVISLPAVAATGLALDPAGQVLYVWFNQLAGLGLGIVALTQFLLASTIRLGFSRNSIVHSACISAMWLSSGLGFRLLSDGNEAGRWILSIVPAVAALAWAFLMRRSGEARPEPPSDGEMAAWSQRLRRALRKAKEEELL